MISTKELCFCPVCGENSFRPRDEKALQCQSCNFLYYHNVAATASAIIQVKDDILMVCRARQPQQGKFDFPGGFIEKNETAEQGLIREIKEELDIDLETTGVYLCNFTNSCHYANIEYHTLDLYFLIALKERPRLNIGDDVANYEWLKVEAIDDNMIAFDSNRNAIQAYKKYLQT